MEIKKIHMISHTNWDREWYLTFERYRYRLVSVLDTLLDIFENEPNFLFYLWDGHTIFLDDYLQIRPENKGKLQRRIEEGRLLVGPWYVMPDEYLPSGESLIRNLLIGIRMARSYGGVMKTGYLVDTFGHISQMPQILKGVDIDNAILWRGIGSELDKTEFIWESPDGTTVLATHLACHEGYGNISIIPRSTGEFVEKIKAMKERLIPHCPTGHILVMNGADYSQPDSRLPKILEQIGWKIGGSQIVQSTIAKYMEEVNKAKPSLITYKGELLSSEKMILLHDVRSTRISVKQRNNEVQNLLEKWAEPMATWAWSLGKPYPQGFLLQAWKYLIQCHLHDSICGSSIDKIQDEVLLRLGWAKSIANEIIEESSEFISKHVNTSSSGLDYLASLVVFNPTSGPRTDYVETEIWCLGEHKNFVARDSRGNIIPHQKGERDFKEIFSMKFRMSDISDLWDRLKGVIGEIRGNIAQNLRISSIDIKQNSKETDVVEIIVYPAREGIFKFMVWNEIKEKLRAFLDGRHLEEFHLRVKVAGKVPLLLLCEGVPAYGYKCYILEYSDSDSGLPQSRGFLANSTSIENQYYKVDIETTGPTLRIWDKITGEVYENCNCFVDEGDKGDTHSFCSPEADRIVSSSDLSFKTSLTEDGPVRRTLKIEFNLELPKSLTENRMSRNDETIMCPIVTSVSLYPKVRRIDIRTEIYNKAKDHRLRVFFPTKIVTDCCYAEGNFDVIKRKIHIAEATRWKERPSGVYPQRTFMDINDGKSGFAVINKGLPEFQVIREEDGSTISLTLLRCVGRLGRSDLNVRHGGGGPFMEIPKAQCLGYYAFEYSLVPHVETWESSEVYRDAHWFNTPLRAHQTGLHSGNLPPELSFIKVTLSSLIVSAIKKTEEGDSLILRLYNIATEDVQGQINMFGRYNEAKLVNLLEEETDSQRLSIEGEGKVTMEFRRGEIKTIGFSKTKRQRAQRIDLHARS